MDLSAVAVQVLAGLTYGMLLFMISVGLSVIFGLMGIVNLAHGVFFVLGAYVAFSVLGAGANFLVALVVAMLAMAVLGLFIERILLFRSYGDELGQVLLTFGLAFIIADIIKMIWGNRLQSLPTPALIDFSVSLGAVTFPAYRLVVVLVGCLLAVLLWYLESRTRIGAIIRAGVDDRQMVAALGINVTLVFAGVFAFGAALAGLGGVLGGPVLGMYPDMGFEILVLSLIVVVLGGLGTWKGAFVGGILVGMVEIFGQAYFPSLSLVIVFLLMAGVLLIRPSGLFGRSPAA
ncbi:High-affinity branched-chain amino acid transport system permease protein LivH [Rubrobacter xylanophilus DSM 9941]|uniref:branched-chain amino acid ABC transporter permease n=1 Tax=Rubrobacter xylanophilus TaxID=49319 RepID=UPI001C63C380|nr:branched-chain amino acid ABC transporter permease [Rubrobacter xylanophilus]QYJ16421.1 High-affinity branched-chain amino acid transport system permease protein LivH [Rubrobacter xylanophilus DSM 9941]